MDNGFSLPFRVAGVKGLLGCLWRNILSNISEGR